MAFEVSREISLPLLFPVCDQSSIRTAENKERNDEEVATKTFVNGQAGEFGIFSR